MYSIYIIVHNHSGRVYVGQTSYPVDLRLQCHFRPSNPCIHLRNAIQKYGRDAFTCYEIAHDLSKEAADTLEIALIAEHGSARTGFNIAVGGPNGRRRSICQRGHDLELPGARTNQHACKRCAQQKGRERYARRRADPVWWAKQCAYLREYKRVWRKTRQAAQAA
jgi:hypothetical protein